MYSDMAAAGDKLKTVSVDLSRTVVVAVTLTNDDLKKYGIDDLPNAVTVSSDDGGNIVNKIEHSIGRFCFDMLC